MASVRTTSKAAPTPGAAFVLNLDRSVDRMNRAREALAALGMETIRIAGVDGARLGAEDRARYDEAAALRLLGRPLLDAEIACSLGHLRALRAVVEQGAPATLVLEDDFGPHPGLADIVPALCAAPLDRWHVMNLIHAPAPWITPVADIRLDGAVHAIARAHRHPTDASALVWSAEGAAAMLEWHGKVTEPWDHAVRRFAMRRDTGLCLVPPLARQRDEGSEIGGTNARRVLRRTPRYRLTRIRSLAAGKARAAFLTAAWRAGRRP